MVTLLVIGDVRFLQLVYTAYQEVVVNSLCFNNNNATSCRSKAACQYDTSRENRIGWFQYNDDEDGLYINL